MKDYNLVIKIHKRSGANGVNMYVYLNILEPLRGNFAFDINVKQLRFHLSISQRCTYTLLGMNDNSSGVPYSLRKLIHTKQK